MAKWQAAHWGESGIELYEFVKGSANSLFSGPVDALAPAKAWLRRRVLVVARSNCIRLRKRYPPAKIDKLRRAVAMEAPDIFPIANPILHCRIHEDYGTHVMLDIWAWDQGTADRLRAAFPFQYTIPEDLAFLSLPPMIHIYQSGSVIHMLACGGGKFFDAVTCCAEDFSSDDIARFRAGLAGNASVIGETRLYGDNILSSEDEAALRIKRIPAASHPLCLAGITDAAFNFKEFRSPALGLPLMNVSLVFRFAIYAIAACGVSLFLTVRNYDHALTDSRTLSRAIDKEIVLMESNSGKGVRDPEAFKEFQDKIKDDLSPLRILDVLASDLPEESYLKSLSLNDGVVDAVVISRDPLSVIKRLGDGGGIRKLSLKGAPVKDTATGKYSCSLSMEIKP